MKAFVREVIDVVTEINALEKRYKSNKTNNFEFSDNVVKDGGITSFVHSIELFFTHVKI